MNADFVLRESIGINRPCSSSNLLSLGSLTVPQLTEIGHELPPIMAFRQNLFIQLTLEAVQVIWYSEASVCLFGWMDVLVPNVSCLDRVKPSELFNFATTSFSWRRQLADVSILTSCGGRKEGGGVKVGSGRGDVSVMVVVGGMGRGSRRRRWDTSECRQAPSHQKWRQNPSCTLFLWRQTKSLAIYVAILEGRRAGGFGGWEN